MTEEVSVSKENPFYWKYKSKPQLLLGASDTDHLFQWTGERLEDHLEELVDAGGNYVRNTMSDRGGECVSPFEKVQEGKYDLKEWNTEYWERFENFLQETEKRNIIVQIEIWDCWDTAHNPFGSERYWEDNPYNPGNNLNYSSQETGLPEEWTYHPMNRDHPFYHAPPCLNDITSVFKYQKAFVEKVLYHALEYDHILYTVCNETRLPDRFSTFWASLIHERAQEEGEQAFVSDMKSDPTTEPVLNHTELFQFAELSQVGELHGEAHYERLLQERKRIQGEPSPLNIVKQYGSNEENGNFYGGKKEVLRKFWRSIFAGYSSFRFHRPDYGIGLDRDAKQMIRSARLLEREIELSDLEPDNSILEDRKVDEAYAVSSKGNYLIYFTDGGNAELEIERGSYEVKWLDIEEGEWKEKEDLNDLELETPSEGQWAALILQK